jgi:hypothetical protein
MLQNGAISSEIADLIASAVVADSSGQSLLSRIPKKLKIKIQLHTDGRTNPSSPETSGAISMVLKSCPSGSKTLIVPPVFFAPHRA